MKKTNKLLLTAIVLTMIFSIVGMFSISASAADEGVHNATLVPQVDATFDSEGSVAYYACSHCGKNFADEACTTELANITTPKLSLEDYTTAVQKGGTDTSPVFTTVFTLKNSSYAVSITSTDGLVINRGAGNVYVSKYDYQKLNTDIVTVTYVEGKGYFYDVKDGKTETGIIGTGIRSFGTMLTITGNVEIVSESNYGHNYGLTIGTDEKIGNLKVVITKSSTYSFALWDGADLVINEGSTLEAVNVSGDTFKINKTGSVVTVAGKLIVQGTINTPGCTLNITSTGSLEATGSFYNGGDIDVTVDGYFKSTYIYSKSTANIKVNGTVALSGRIEVKTCNSFVINEGGSVTAGANVTVPGAASANANYEYGFKPRVLILGSLTINNGALKVNSLQVGSEKEGKRGTLNISCNENSIQYSSSSAEVRYALSNGSISVKNTGTGNICAMNMGSTVGVYADIGSGMSISLDGKYGSVIGQWQNANVNVTIAEGASVDLGGNSYFIRMGDGFSKTFNVYCWNTATVKVGGEYKEVRTVKKFTYNTSVYHNLVDNSFYTNVRNAAYTNTGATLACGNLGTFTEATYTDANGNTSTIYYSVVGDHVHTNSIVTGSPADCVNSGIADYYTCSVCYGSFSDEAGNNEITEPIVIDPLGHTLANAVVENYVDPDCVTDGSYDSVVYCSVCSAEVSRQSVAVDALGHDIVIDAAVAATCTSTGLTAGEHCRNCDGATVAQTVVDTIPHDLDADSVCRSCGLVPLPKAEVNELKATLEDLETPLTFALNFKIKDAQNFSESYLDALMRRYGDYYVDYVLTVSGLNSAGVTFNANGNADGYLAGQYNAWSKNWVYVPFDNVTLANGESLYIMSYAAELIGKTGLRYTLEEVAEVVQSFNCGVYFTDEFMAQNPDMVVTLELKIFTEDTVGNEIDSTVLARNVFTLGDRVVKLPNAEVTDIKDSLTNNDPDLTFALNFTIEDIERLDPNSPNYDKEYADKLWAEYGHYYVDYVFTVSGLTSPSFTFNAGGGADGYLAGQYDTWSSNWVTVPFNDVTLANGESLYIMAYAAELIGKTGLRYTLEEIADVVVDFDCGAYFTREFIEANPDAVITLKLVLFTEDDNGNIVDSCNLAINEFYFSDIVAVVEGEGAQTHYCTSLQSAFNVAENGETITVIKNINLTSTVNVSGAKTVALNLNGKNVTINGQILMSVSDGATVKISGNGKMLGNSTIFAVTDATVELYDGIYSENVGEKGSDLCADGYNGLVTIDGLYIVGSKPSATVNNLGSVNVPSDEYGIYDGSFKYPDTGIEMPLSFVMQFLADQNAEDMLTSPFADWYADFVIVFDGIENGSFLAEGCYLAGYYGSWGWIKVPVDDMTIENGARYPVMLGIRAGQKYDYICSDVKDFRCALYIPQEILDANPNLSVTLSLNLVDNSAGQDTAADTLANGTNYNEIASYTFKSEYFKGPAAEIDGKKYYELQDAFDALQVGDVLVVLRDNQLVAQIVLDKNVTIDFDGFDVTTADGTDFAIKAATGFTIIALGEDKYAIIGVPHIGANGNWWVGYDDTGVKATGNDGVGIDECHTEDIIDANGKVIGHKVTITFTDGREPVVIEVLHGKDGKDAIIPMFEIRDDGNLWISYDNGNSWSNLGKVVGEDGTPGTPGAPGQEGRGVKSVVIDENGHLIITYTDNTTLDLGKVVGENGAPGTPGTPGTPGAPGAGGEDGLDGKTPLFKLEENGDIYLRYDETEDWTLLGNIMGKTGETGAPGAPGATGADGASSNLAVLITALVAIAAIVMSAVALVYVNKYSYKPWWMI